MVVLLFSFFFSKNGFVVSILTNSFAVFSLYTLRNRGTPSVVVHCQKLLWSSVQCDHTALVVQ